MILEDEEPRSVNVVMDFRPDGKVVNYNSSGEETDVATYELKQGSIVYSDKNGKQKWKLKKFGNGKLVVDHLGAQMFFEKQ